MGIVERVTDKIIGNHNLHTEGSLCSRFRTLKSGCSLCADVCPAGAISLSGKGPEITGGACIGCGVCLSVCPNGVFTMKEGGDEEIIDEMVKAAERYGMEEAKEFLISCQRGECNADLLVPCLGRLTEALLIEPVRQGFSKMTVFRPECAECPNSKASSHFDRTITRVLVLFEMLGIARESLAVRRMPLQPLAKRPEEPVSRRELFSALRTKAAEMAVAALPEAGGKGNAEEQTFLEAISKKPGNLKRTLLLRSLGMFTPVKEVFIPSEEAILAEISVSSQCTACGVCATLCPTGALTQAWNDKRFLLSFRPSLCTNCGICAETCMPEAVTAGKTARLNGLMEDKEVNVFEAVKKTCPVCGMDFIPPSEGRQVMEAAAALPDACPLCLDRHKKHMALLKNGFLKWGG